MIMYEKVFLINLYKLYFFSSGKIGIAVISSINAYKQTTSIKVPTLLSIQLSASFTCNKYAL